MVQIRYPIGIQTFSHIITGNYVYVDKTDLVYDLTQRYRYVFLSRPRRFGKSLLVSTLEAYFKGEKELFKDLAIGKLEKDWHKHPVFRFDFSTANYVDTSRLIDLINWCLGDIEKEYSLFTTERNISLRFRELIKLAFEKYGSQVVILIDEYDKPMLDCLHDSGHHEKLKAELRSFYSVIKASGQYLKFVMLTGITKFGKISVFSGLNNLKDISMTPRYNGICGITETEFHRDFKEPLSEFAIEHSITEAEAWEKFRLKYDGYHFASRGEGIYNPFSVINAFDENELKNFWYATGSPSYLIRLIEQNHYKLDSIDGQLRKEDQLSDITDTRSDFLPLLYQSGYLTIKGYYPDTQEYLLGFPNQEVESSFWNSLTNRFLWGRYNNSSFTLRKCVSDVNEGHPEEFMLSMQSLFADTSSEYERDKEIHFQNMMAIAAKMMGLTVRTEIHSSKGRCDMQILTDRYVYIFEFKINGRPEDAIRQIKDKGYAVPFAADTRTVFIIGANFSTDTRTLNGWIIETL